MRLLLFFVEIKFISSSMYVYFAWVGFSVECIKYILKRYMGCPDWLKLNPKRPWLFLNK